MGIIAQNRWSSADLKTSRTSPAVGFVNCRLDNLEASLAERIGRDQMKREPCWTESLAVGSAEFVERIKPLILSRLDTEIIEQSAERWVLQEAATAYG